MTDDTLSRLRAVNPVPIVPDPPPIDRVHALIAGRRSATETPGPRRRRPWAGALVPAFGVAVALAVAVLALIMIGHGTRAGRHVAASRQTHPAETAAPRVVLPPGGMPGVVQLWGAAMSPAGDGVLSFEQCSPCDSTQAFAEWTATTHDGGAQWTVQRRAFYLFDPQFSGAADMWADGQNRGAIVNAVWVSHDAGMNFTRATLAAPSNAPGSASAAAGEAWATAVQCSPTCRTTILHGPATGATLAPTSAQPPVHGGNARLIAASRRTAYLEVLRGRVADHFATHDGGRTWSTTGTACNGDFADSALAADGPDSLWEQCLFHGKFSLAHSIDAGRTWRTQPMPFGGVFQLRPVGGGTVWAITDAGTVLRSQNGGARWRAVLDAGPRAVLMTADATTALAVRTIGRGHVHHHAASTNLIAYRTSDGGAHWHGTAIALSRH